MEFRKYQHIERFGTDEVQGIELGTVFIFPKIDGTNASVWLNNGELKAGSRNRALSLESDNAGFYAAMLDDQRIHDYLVKHPEHRLYGEWLVPHSLKTYRQDAWRKFYIFDVCLDRDDTVEYIPYDIYKPMLEEFNLDYIPPIATVKNGTYEAFLKALDKNTFLIEDGKGVGEGIVIKNYDFYNKYRRQTWAKIVTNEFKEKNAKAFGVPMSTIQTGKMVEEEIIDQFCTDALIEKEYAKIVAEKEGWRSEYIPILLGRVFHELITEESWNFVKKFKMPTINFKTLNTLAINKVKAVKSDIF